MKAKTIMTKVNSVNRAGLITCRDRLLRIGQGNTIAQKRTEDIEKRLDCEHKVQCYIHAYFRAVWWLCTALLSNGKDRMENNRKEYFTLLAWYSRYRKDRSAYMRSLCYLSIENKGLTNMSVGLRQ